jgi:hypothetical protein
MPRKVHISETCESRLQVPPSNEAPPPMRGCQAFDQPCKGTAPLGAPFEKDRVRLQVGLLPCLETAGTTAAAVACQGAALEQWSALEVSCLTPSSCKPAA